MTKTENILKRHGVVWAFSPDQFETQKRPDTKYVSIGHGGYCPKGNLDSLLADLEKLNKANKARERKDLEKNQSLKKAADLIKEISKEMREEYGYDCGFAETDVFKKGTNKQNKELLQGFFESPDGQNIELYYKLEEHGYNKGTIQADYHWTRTNKKQGVSISFVEGDVYIVQL